VRDNDLTYFKDNAKKMADFYRALPDIEPLAQSDDMSIFMSGESKIFVHPNYPASESEMPPNTTAP
jgi:hypothetical protein